MLIYTKGFHLTRSIIDTVMYLRKNLFLPLERSNIIFGEYTIAHIRNRTYCVSLTKEQSSFQKGR